MGGRLFACIGLSAWAGWKLAWSEFWRCLIGRVDLLLWPVDIGVLRAVVPLQWLREVLAAAQGNLRNFGVPPFCALAHGWFFHALASSHQSVQIMRDFMVITADQCGSMSNKRYPSFISSRQIRQRIVLKALTVAHKSDLRFSSKVTVK